MLLSTISITFSQWKPIASIVTNFPILSLQSIGSDTVCIFNENYLSISTDGSESFITRRLPDEAVSKDAFIASNGIIYCSQVNSRSYLLSSDLGKTWQDFYVPSGTIKVTNTYKGSKLWAICDHRELKYFNTQSSEWDEIYTDNHGKIQDICFVNDTLGWKVLENSEFGSYGYSLYSTEDGGYNWTLDIEQLNTGFFTPDYFKDERYQMLLPVDSLSVCVLKKCEESTSYIAPALEYSKMIILNTNWDYNKYTLNNPEVKLSFLNKDAYLYNNQETGSQLTGEEGVFYHGAPEHQTWYQPLTPQSLFGANIVDHFRVQELLLVNDTTGFAAIQLSFISDSQLYNKVFKMSKEVEAVNSNSNLVKTDVFEYSNGRLHLNSSVWQHISLYSMQGRLLFKQKLNKRTKTITIPRLSNGKYVLSLHSSNNKLNKVITVP